MASSNTPVKTADLPVLKLSKIPYKNGFLATESELVGHALALAGYKMELVALPTIRSLRYAAEGIVDGELYRSYDSAAKYDSLIILQPPISTQHYWVWVLPETQCPKTLQALYQLKLVSVLGVSYYKRAIDLSETGHIQATSPVRALKVLHSGRADYTVASERGIRRASSTPLSDFKRCFDKSLFSIHYHTTLNRKHQAKVPGIEKALERTLAEKRTFE